MSEVLEEGGKRRLFRLVVRCCALAAAVILALPILPWSWTPLIWPSLSSHVLICSTIAARAISVATLVGLPVLVIVLFRRRWFCRYGCPVGLLAEYAGRLHFWGKSSVAKLPHVGRWAALLTFGGALFGYTFFLWLDPLAIFQGVFTLRSDPHNLAGQASAIALGLVLVVSLLIPGAWCMRICPLGATQELLAMPQRLFRRKKAPAEPSPVANNRLLSRRSAFSAVVGAGCAVLGAGWARSASKQSANNQSNVLRPPGAIDEGSFAGLCIRCGNCVRACPTKIIQPEPSSGGIAGFLTPALSFAEDYCHEDCHKCTEVCPSGAIAQLSLEEKANARIGVAKFDVSLCLLYEDRECNICRNACPYQAIEIIWNEEEYVRLPRVIADKCPGCGACEFFCPGVNDWERENSEEPIPVRKALEVVPHKA